MNRDEALRAFDHFKDRAETVQLGAHYMPDRVPENWDVAVRPDDHADLRELVDHAEAGGFHLVLRMLSQGYFTVLTDEEHKRQALIG